MKPDWRFCFWTPGHTPAVDGRTFGCASHGFAAPGTWCGPDEAAVAYWPVPGKGGIRGLAGDVLAGTYGAVLDKLGRLSWRPAAVIVLFAQPSGMEVFLKHWQSLLPEVPVVGGCAARGGGQTSGGILPAATEVTVLLLRGGAWCAESLNLHDLTGPGVEFRSEGARTITWVRETSGDWQKAVAFFQDRQGACGRAVTDCESMTLCDANGRNLHVSFEGERLHTGADLPEEGLLTLRTLSRADAAKRLKAFCAVSDALVFGCAGLRGLLDAPLTVGPGVLAGFLFGELVTLEGTPQFGNLMAARLRPVMA